MFLAYAVVGALALEAMAAVDGEHGTPLAESPRRIGTRQFAGCEVYDSKLDIVAVRVGFEPTTAAWNL
jgi:hypothetical protein